VTPPGIDPETVRLVAQCLNHYATPDPVYEVAWKNIVESVRPEMTVRRIACCIPKATNTCSEYAILIASPLHQWLHEPSSVLRYRYIARLVYKIS
jgi:hypothetical protein